LGVTDGRRGIDRHLNRAGRDQTSTRASCTRIRIVLRTRSVEYNTSVGHYANNTITTNEPPSFAVRRVHGIVVFPFVVGFFYCAPSVSSGKPDATINKYCGGTVRERAVSASRCRDRVIFDYLKTDEKTINEKPTCDCRVQLISLVRVTKYLYRF